MKNLTLKFIEYLMANYSITSDRPDDNYKYQIPGYYIKRGTYSNFGHNWKTIDEIRKEFNDLSRKP